MGQLNTLKQRQTQFQSAVSTGRRVQTADEDPSAIRSVLDLSTEARSLAQYQKNIVNLKSQAVSAMSTIKSLKTVTDRASEIAMTADSTRTPSDLNSYAQEISQLIQQVAQVTNAKNGEDYMFAGTQTSQAPIELTKDADGWITSYTYHGNASTSEVDITASSSVSVGNPAVNTSGTGETGLLADSRNGSDLIQHLIDLQNNLRNGTVSEIAKTDRVNISKDLDNLIGHVASNAATQTRLDTTKSLATSRTTDIHDAISNKIDADAAQSMMQLSQTQYAYQAALQSGASLMGKSLLDYLS